MGTTYKRHATSDATRRSLLQATRPGLADYQLRQAGWEISHRDPNTGEGVYFLRDTKSTRPMCVLNWLGDNVPATVFVGAEPVEYKPPIDILVMTAETVRRIKEVYPNAVLNVPDEVWLMDCEPIPTGEPWPSKKAITEADTYALEARG